MAVRDTKAMIARMKPVLAEGRFVFCAPDNGELADQCRQSCVAMIHEDEGLSFVMHLKDAQALPLEPSPVMSKITLTVHSDLEGVGLTAAVATTLAKQDIPCNVIAGFHHDHIFVPEAKADLALSLLQQLSDSAHD